MLIAGHETKVVAGDDGKAWLCVAVTSSDIEAMVDICVDLAGKFRALKGKVRTAQITRFREELPKVA